MEQSYGETKLESNGETWEQKYGGTKLESNEETWNKVTEKQS